MKLKDGFVLRDVAGQTMVIATGKTSREFHGMIRLNETGKIVWQGIADGLSADEIAGRLTERFDVSAECALADVNVMTAKMAEAGILCP